MRSVMLLWCATATACAPGIGTQVRYEIGLPPNVTISAEAGDSADAFRGLDVALHVSRVQPDCSLGFLGTIPVSIWDSQGFALQPGTVHYVVLALEGGKLKGGDNRRNIALMIDPREQYAYRLTLAYADASYQIRLLERAPNGSERPIPHEPHACEPET